MATSFNPPYAFGASLAPSKQAATSKILDDPVPRDGFYVARFEYQRPPGVLATGLCIVPKDTVGDWSKCVFSTLEYDEEGKPQVLSYTLDWKKPEEQRVILEAVENVQYLVFKTGKRAEVDGRDMQAFQLMLRMTKPMFDEQGIINMIAEDQYSADWLLTNNSFGTWADVVHGKITEKTGEVLGWEKVGRDPRLMPEDKVLQFLQPSVSPSQASEIDLESDSEWVGGGSEWV